MAMHNFEKKNIIYIQSLELDIVKNTPVPEKKYT